MIVRGASLSEDLLYRYVLWRTWDPSKPELLWIMLNPSTADADFDDPTIRRVMAFSLREGAGTVRVVNLFAFRSTDPKSLISHPDPIGPRNDDVIWEELRRPALLGVVAAWGADPAAEKLQRARAVRNLVEDAVDGLVCFGKTSRGAPRHPLYLPSDAPLELFP